MRVQMQCDLADALIVQNSSGPASDRKVYVQLPLMHVILISVLIPSDCLDGNM